MEKIKLDIQLFAVTKSTTFSEPTLTDAMISGNYSTLKITIRFSPNNDVTYFSSKTLKCTCNGTQKTATVSLSKGSYVSKTFTFDNISHNADGTKSVSWSWSCATGTSVLGTISSSGTRTLQTIPRASEIDSVTDGTTPFYPTIKWTPKNSGFKFKVLIYYNNGVLYEQSGLISPNQTTQYTYNGLEIRNTFFNNELYFTHEEFIVKLITYQSDGTTEIGRKTYNNQTNATLDTSIKPTISNINNIVEADSTMIGLNWGVFVKGKSKISYDLKYSFPSPVPGSATIATDTNGQPLSANATISTNTQTKTFTTNVLNTVGNNNISSTIIDSRTRTTSYTSSNAYSVVDYSDPTITTAIAKRVNDSNIEDDEGTKLNITFEATISPVNNKNTNIFRIGYRVKGSNTNFTYKTLVNDDKTTYSVPNTYVNKKIDDWTLSSSNAYEIVFEAIDSFRTASNPVKQTRYIETGKPLMNFNASGKAMAIGKVSEAGANEEKLEVALHTTFIPDTDMYSSIEIDSSNRNEASIAYYNETKTKRYVAGYGTASFDGFGIYSDETTKNVFQIDKNGNTNIQKYSTNEVQIGIWIDGKPLYRKVFNNLTTPSSTGSWTTLVEESSSASIFTNIYGCVIDGSAFNSINTGEGSYYIHTQVNYISNKTQIRMIQNGWSSKPCFVVVEYTKSTD